MEDGPPSKRNSNLRKPRSRPDLESGASGLQAKRLGATKLRIQLPERHPTSAGDIRNDRDSDSVASTTGRFATFCDFFRQLSSLRRFGWITGRFNLYDLRPVLRCSLSMWISLLLVIIPKSRNILGQVSANCRQYKPPNR